MPKLRTGRAALLLVLWFVTASSASAAPLETPVIMTWLTDRQRDYTPHSIVVPKIARYVTPTVERGRVVHGVHVRRTYGQSYAGYGFSTSDEDSWKFLAFTAMGLNVLTPLTAPQQRAHEAAFALAAYEPIGEPIMWREGVRSGRVTAVRQGSSKGERLCREFEQEITIGAARTVGSGIGCEQSNGSWRVIQIHPQIEP